MKLPDKPDVVMEKYVSFRGNGYHISLMFASEKGKQEFIRKWCEIRPQLEVLMQMSEDNHPRLEL